MPRLTKKRKKKAKRILKKHNRLLETEVPGDVDPPALEADLVRCWNLDYQQLKGVIIDMFANHPEYRELAIRYMKHFPCAEFHESFHRYREEGGELWPEVGDPI